MAFFLNNRKYEMEKTKKNRLIYQVVSQCGIDLPCFCYSEALSVAGNCRMCLIEVKGSPKLLASCAVVLNNNMELFTESLRLKKAREGILELLLINHPLDCPVCDQGGECDLQDLTFRFGSDRGRFYESEKRAVNNKNAGIFVKTVMTRCIHCTRCVRFFKDIVGILNIGLYGRGESSEIILLQNLNHPLSSNVVDVCPVGALTSKPYAFSARPWELHSFESFDVFDSMCSNIKINFSLGKIMRILPVNNFVLNEDWLTNKSRFFFDALQKQRIYNNFLIDASLQRIKLGLNESIYALFSIFSNLVWETKNLNLKSDKFLNLEDGMELVDLFNRVGKYDASIYDFRNMFLCDVDFNVIDKMYYYIYLVGLNLRVDMPLLNVKINRFAVKDNIKILCVGSNVMANFDNITTIGNSLYDFLKIRLNRCAFLQGILLNYGVLPHGFKSMYNLLNTIIFVNSKCMVNYFFGVSILDKVGKLCLFSLELGSIIKGELGFAVNNDVSDRSLVFFYGWNPFKNLLDKDSINIIFNSHFFSDFVFSDLIIAKLLMYEVDKTFINFYGNVSKVSNLLHTANEYNISGVLLKMCNWFLNKSIVSLFKYYNYSFLRYFIEFNLTTYNLVWVKVCSLYLYNLGNLYKYQYYNHTIFINNYIDYYQTDFSGVMSLIIAKAGKININNISVYK